MQWLKVEDVPVGPCVEERTRQDVTLLELTPLKRQIPLVANCEEVRKRVRISRKPQTECYPCAEANDCACFEVFMRRTSIITCL